MSMETDTQNKIEKIYPDFFIEFYSNNQYSAGCVIVKVHISDNGTQAAYSQICGGTVGGHMAWKTLDELKKVLRQTDLEERLQSIRKMPRARVMNNFAFSIDFVDRSELNPPGGHPMLGSIRIFRRVRKNGSRFEAFHSVRTSCKWTTTLQFKEGHLLTQLKEVLERNEAANRQFFDGWNKPQKILFPPVQYTLRFFEDWTGPVMAEYAEEAQGNRNLQWKNRKWHGGITYSDTRERKSRLAKTSAALQGILGLCDSEIAFPCTVAVIKQTLNKLRNSSIDLGEVTASVTLVGRELVRDALNACGAAPLRKSDGLVNEAQQPKGLKQSDLDLHSQACHFLQQAHLVLHDPNVTHERAIDAVKKIRNVLDSFKGEVIFSETFCRPGTPMNCEDWTPVCSLEYFGRLNKYEGGCRWVQIWRKGTTYKALYWFQLRPMPTDVMRSPNKKRHDDAAFRREPANTEVVQEDARRFLNDFRVILRRATHSVAHRVA
jgi:hypothetical protein